MMTQIGHGSALLTVCVSFQFLWAVTFIGSSDTLACYILVRLYHDIFLRYWC